MTAKLGKVAITKKAAAIARRDGVRAITVRRVASELRVTPMALYRYVGSSDGLRIASLEFMLLDVAAPPLEGSVAERLERWGHDARAALARYPGLADAVLTDWAALLQGCRIVEALLVVAADAAPDDHRRVEIANSVFMYVLMRVSAERAVARGLASKRQRSLPMVQRYPERFPQLAAVSDQFAAVDFDHHFAVGLRALLDGVDGVGVGP